MISALKMLFQRLFDYDDEDDYQPDESTGWN